MSIVSETNDGVKCVEFSEVIKIDEGKVRQHVEEVVRQSVEETLNGLLEAEADELCGAKRYERSAERLDTRAGHYERKLQTKAGEVTLKVPRLRKLPFETQIIERYRRRESSIEEAMIEMYLAGVSVRRVEDITEALWGTRVSPSTVSELNQKIYVHIDAWRNRPIEGEHPYVFLDGIWLKRSWGGEVENVAVLVAIGVGSDGYREILGVCEGTKEDKESWRNFLRHLKERGLKGVRLVISDKCLGLVEALGEFYPEAQWQRCVVHWYRNVFTAVPKGKVKGSGGDAQGDPRPGGPPGGRQEGRGRGGEAGGHEAWAKRPQIVREGVDETLQLHGVPDGALASDPHEQSAGADHAGDSPADSRGGQLPRRAVGVDAGGGPAAAHRGHALGHEAIPGHGTA